MIVAHALKIGADLELVLLPERRLGRQTVDEIEAALEHHDAGDIDGARALLRMLEIRLGVTEHHRVAAASGRPAGAFLLIGAGAQLAANVKASKAVKASAERQRVLALIPRDNPPMTDKDRYDLQAVEQKLDEARKHKAAGNRRLAKARVQDAQRLLLSIERSRLDRLNARWAARVLEEIEALETALGGTVERRSQAGGTPLQILGRDGLYSIRGGTTKTQAAAGLAYREIYEKTDPERALKPKSIDPADQPAGHGGEGWAEKRAKLWNTRKAIEARVKSVAGERGLYVLQEVAGKGRAVSSLTTGGRRRARDAQKLLQALDEVAFALGF